MKVNQSFSFKIDLTSLRVPYWLNMQITIYKDTRALGRMKA